MVAILGFAAAAPEIHAKPPQPTNSFGVIPTISLSVSNGVLSASGNVSSVIRGRTNETTFDIPLSIQLAADQTNTTNCATLELMIDEIVSENAGLALVTGPVCLRVAGADNTGTSFPALLCKLGDLLESGLTITQALSGASVINTNTGTTNITGLSTFNVTNIVSGLSNIVNGAVQSLLDAELTNSKDHGRGGRSLQFDLEPTTLTIGGLPVSIDDCEGGPVHVGLAVRHGQSLGRANSLFGKLKSRHFRGDMTLEDVVNEASQF